MRRRSLLLGAAALPGLSRMAAAQDLPAGPIRLVVGFAPGGGIDSFARILARRAQDLTGRAFVVDNRPGAGGTIAAAHVARSAPDGTTLLVGENGVIATARAVFASLPYDPERDLAPVSLCVVQSVLCCARPTVATDLPGLIAAARARPGALSYASAGAGNPTHLFAADFARRAGIEAVHVPYRGGSQMVASVLAGETAFGFFSAASALPQVRNGGLAALAVGDEQPAPLLPDVPPAGRVLPGFTFAFWYGINAAGGTPAPLVAALSTTIGTALRHPETRSSLEAQGLKVAATGPSDYAAFAAAETLRWSEVARLAGVTPE
ncbi:Bug family tripartite tricarboxylate transporter substrate binding protein [Roseomonas sp. CCTCC AB2023176]|uniref:Bug family tripartite tricarboxylate transporter substrate binding protein n=1 Tax=Roseomonas sp. CCTCC AB2023176 TaxID=3342640 RepID=UPI0035DBD8A4